MKNLRNLFFNEIDNEAMNDEVDRLYAQLEQIEPPFFLVDDIMAAVARLPRAQSQVIGEPQRLQLDFDGLINSIATSSETLSLSISPSIRAPQQ